MTVKDRFKENIKNANAIYDGDTFVFYPLPCKPYQLQMHTMQLRKFSVKPNMQKYHSYNFRY